MENVNNNNNNTSNNNDIMIMMQEMMRTMNEDFNRRLRDSTTETYAMINSRMDRIENAVESNSFVTRRIQEREGERFGTPLQYPLSNTTTDRVPLTDYISRAHYEDNNSPPARRTAAVAASQDEIKDLNNKKDLNNNDEDSDERRRVKKHTGFQGIPEAFRMSLGKDPAKIDKKIHMSLDTSDDEEGFVKEREEFKVPSNKDFVNTMFGRAAIHAGNIDFSKINIATEPPSTASLYLKRLTVVSLATFVFEYARYKSMYQWAPNINSLVDQPIVDVLIARNPGLTVARFYELTPPELLYILQKEVYPKTQLQFTQQLVDYVELHLPPGYKPSTSSFKPFYQALLQFKDAFLKAFEIMATNNAKNVPPMDAKDNGVLRVFLKKIPFRYGLNVYSTLEVKHFANLYQFLKSFFAVVQIHYEDCERARVVGQFLYFDGDTRATSKQSLGNSEDVNKKPAYSRFKSSDNKDKFRNKSSFANKKSYPNARLHHIGNESAPAEEYHDVDVDSWIPPSSLVDRQEDGNRFVNLNDRPWFSVDKDSDESSNDSSSEFDEQEESLYEEEDSDPAGGIPIAPTESRSERVQQLKHFSKDASKDFSNKPMMRENQTKAVEPLACRQMLLFDTCPHGSKCKYSHLPNDLRKAHAWLSKHLSNSKYKESVASVSVLRKPNNTLSMITAELLDPLHNVIDSLPEAALFKAVHRAGILSVPSGEIIPVNKCLFDSGALSASYLSEAFVREHFSTLRKHIKKCDTIVKLADNHTSLRLTWSLLMTVIFTDDIGKEYSADVLFLVLPTMANDMIIGLPDIVRSFLELLHTMLKSALVSPAAHASAPTLQSLDTQTSDVLVPPIADGTVLSPWSVQADVEAPEDLATPLPSSFPDALHYMEHSYEEAVQEFYDLFPTHVAPEFVSSTDILNLLRTKGVNVFVPQNWEGIKVPPIDLQWSDDLPSYHKPKARPINPKLMDNALQEFIRLRKYFYVESNSPLASCLVIAPKATPPYIRFCGDYVFMNRFIRVGHYPIPYVRKALDKIITFELFLDFDLVNSFHQFLLSLRTSENLSIQTPWGQFRPLFMPEGIGPASAILQEAMTNIFAPFSDWAIVIFDNLLVLAHNYQDAYEKTEKILDKCMEYNLFLKFSKTWLGYKEAKFFGYICRPGRYELGHERKEAILKLPMPASMKQMQSFLGAALFFQPFVPHFATHAALLHEMTHKSFVWDPSTWKADYRKAFDDFKQVLVASTALYYPDYNLKWILRTDASRYGVGAVLIQVSIDPSTNAEVLQPIGFESSKFSPQALNWTTIEQEAYGIYFGVRQFAYYLTCKHFTIETDHSNLQWIEQSLVPKVIRWRIYLQSFSFNIRHIKGKLNNLADLLSRLLPASDALQLVSPPTVSADNPTSPEQVLKQVHGGRSGHFGVRFTWNELNRRFPGHGIPYRVVSEFVATCTICQKDRLGMVDNIPSIYRPLQPSHARALVGIDVLTVSPKDELNNEYIIVIVNIFTKYTALYPSPTKDEIAQAQALFQYACTFGLFDVLVSDPGSEYTGRIIAQLTKWLNIHHRISLVDRHQSNGVEGTNKQILRHLRALVYDERVIHCWSSPTVLPLIQYLLNSSHSSEAGVTPLHATFGTAEEIYTQLPAIRDRGRNGEEKDQSAAFQSAYVQALDSNLKHLRSVSLKHQLANAQIRTSDNPLPTQHNKFQPGDYVLFQIDKSKPRKSKLSPQFLGPYEVVGQVSNDIQVRNILTGAITVVHVDRVKIFHGSKEEAFETAKLDNDSYVITSITAFRGNPELRTSMEFLVLFEDTSLKWMPFESDVSQTIQFEEYIRSKPELYVLLFTAKLAAKYKSDLNKQQIVELEPGDVRLVDLRSYGATWYQSLPLPDKDRLTYLLPYHYLRWANNRHTKIVAECKLLDEVFEVDHFFIKHWSYRSTDGQPAESEVIIDSNFILIYPELIDETKKENLLNKLLRNA